MSDFNLNGPFTIFTSDYLRKKGYCCKSTCLHCPYGFTLSKVGLKFRLPLSEDKAFIEECFKAGAVVTSNVFSVSASLLGSANKSKVQRLEDFPISEIQIISLKEHDVGWTAIKAKRIQFLALLPQFANQGIDRDEVCDQFLHSLGL